MSSNNNSSTDHPSRAPDSGGPSRLRAQLDNAPDSSPPRLSSTLDDPLLSPGPPRRGSGPPTSPTPASPILRPSASQQDQHQQQQPLSISFQDTPHNMTRNYDSIAPSSSDANAPLRNVYDDSDDRPQGSTHTNPSRPAIVRGDSTDNRAASIASTNPRSISFKRRGHPRGNRNASAADPSSSRLSTAADGNGRRLSSFIHRASFGALGRPSTPTNLPSQGRHPRKSFAAVSQASTDAVARWRNMRRVHTLSIHPPTGGDPEDPSSWSFPETKPQIPTLLPDPSAPPANPLPWLPFTVLCLVCFGEFSSAGVAGPFLFFMIDSFNVGGESDVGFWAGITSSVFFFAQFLTSLLWASIADKYGRRAVLLTSLCGNAITLAIFGASTNLKMAITVRLAQGTFNGAVGVAKGAIRDLTDPTNEGRAYAILGFAWGFGGILGPILGGVLEHPVDKFPFLFADVDLFKQYPYLLPCLAGASFTTLGACLSLFIGPDGGPREGGIKLEVDTAADANAQVSPAVGHDNQSAFSTRNSVVVDRPAEADAFAAQSNQGQSGTPAIGMGPTLHASGAGMPRTFTQQVDEETGGPPSPLDSDDEGTIVTRDGNRNRRGSQSANSQPHAQAWRLSRTEERRRGILGGGSAYGYEPSASGDRQRRDSRHSQLSGAQEFARSMPRNRRLHALAAANSSGFANAPGVSASGNANRLSLANSAMGSAFNYAPDFEAVGEDPALAPQPRRLNFAQRFLLANDDAVSSITDLWVAAAINGDEVYSALEEDESDEEMYRDDAGEDDAANDSQVIDGDSSYDDGGSSAGLDEGSADEDDVQQQSGQSGVDHRVAGSSTSARRRPYLPPLNFAQRRSTRAASNYARPRSMRMGSFAQGRMPSLYSNTGIDLPSPWNEMPPNSDALYGADGSVVPAPPAAATTSQQPGKQGGYDPTLAGIPESASARNTLGREQGAQVSDERQRLLREQESTAAGAKVAVAPTPPSLFSLLPLTIIAHYGLMAFHSATVDQVFMAFLVTPYSSGGLGLTAAHYAELISAMAFCQIGFQFYFYPKIGPPQGKRSHLAMMRLGTLLHPFAYLAFPLLRNFLHPSTDAIVMTFMIIFASLRWLANICAFTAVSILMNALTPPNLVPLANGLAQTTSSAARFIGPIIGGVVWAKGIEGGVDNHTWPLNYHLGFEFVGVVAFLGFLHAFFVLKSSA